MNDVSVCAATTWVMLADQVDDVFEDTSFASIPGAVATVAGEGLLDLRADGTYVYTPAFTAQITIADLTADGAWSGSATGTWQIVGDRLSMAQATNDVSGTLTLFGNPMPLPPIGVLNGEGRVIDCSPATLEIELDTPVGVLSHTLVAA